MMAGDISTGWAERVADPKGRKAAQELNKIDISTDDVVRALLFAIDQPVDVTVNGIVISPTRHD